MSLTIRSSAFAEGQAIPRRHTEDGEDLSPPLAWSNVPAGTRELVLIVDDPDAPGEDAWIHWILMKVPASADGLAEGIAPVSRPAAPAGCVQARNSWKAPGYRGPAPPQGHGLHHYHFKLYALDAPLELDPDVEKHDLMMAMSGHILGHGELVGTYQR